MSVLLVAEYWIVVLFSWLALRPLLPLLLQRPPEVFAFLPGLITLAGVAVFMWLGQGGSGISPARRQKADSARPVGDRTEDRFWKLGVFYFNRNDPAVMVEKRFGIGYTMNFAHPVAWLIFLLLLVPVAFTLVRRVR